MTESNELKLRANNLFGSSRYLEAIQEYDKALQSCPNYLDYEIAILRSNIAACHLKLEDWKAVVTAASSSIESLDRLGPLEADKTHAEDSVRAPNSNDDVVKKKPPCTTDIQRIRAKSLMRRARARCELGGWAALQGAEEGQSNAGQLTRLAITNTAETRLQTPLRNGRHLSCRPENDTIAAPLPPAASRRSQASRNRADDGEIKGGIIPCPLAQAVKRHFLNHS